MASKLNRIKQKPLNSILKELVGGDAGLSQPSEAYTELVEKVCDDLLEAADKQIDLLKNQGKETALQVA